MRCSWYSRGILIGGAFFYSFYNILLTFVHIPQNPVECPPLNPKNLLQIYQSYSQLQKPQLLVPSEPLNWRDVRVLTEPSENVCDAKVLFVIHSSPENSLERTYLRNDIFGPAIKQGVSIKVFFIVGYTPDRELHTKVANEAFQFEDVLLLDIEEHYHNITHKARAWVTYIYEKCIESYKRPHFIVKMDDDVSIDLPGVLNVTDLFMAFKKIIFGRVYSDGPVVRNPQSKWYLSKSEYSPSSLGVYCQGMAYGFTFDLLPKMYDNLRRVQYLWMDDWYVTHALVYQSQAIYFDLQSHYISIDSLQDLQKLVSGQVKNRRRLLFGHFRPKSRFPLEKRKSTWQHLQRLHSCI